MSPGLPEPPTGTQHRLALDGPSGHVEAVVTELAASLRLLRVDGRPLVHEYAEDSPPPWGAGIVLVPWPNRVAGSRWSWRGREQRLDVTEPSTGNANHGLLRNTGYVATASDPASVTLAAPVFPQHGYPFHLRTEVRYALQPDGLEVTHAVTNVGHDQAPVAVGSHPYLRVGEVPVGELVLTVDAAERLETDDRSIPVAQHPVDAATDLRAGRRLAEVTLDTCYTSLRADAGTVAHRLTAPDGSATELWAEEVFGWVQVFTNPRFPTPGGGEELAVAVEPMTGPPDALNSGNGLRWLAPAERWELRWGLRSVAA